MKIISILSILLLVSFGCEFKDPTFGGVSNFEMINFSDNVLTCSLDVKVGNPNTFNLKVKPSVVDVFVDNVLFGKINLDKKIKFKKKSDQTYTVPLRIILEKGMMMKMMGLMLKSKINIRFFGKVKGSARGLSKRMPIDITKELDPSVLKGIFQK